MEVKKVKIMKPKLFTIIPLRESSIGQPIDKSVFPEYTKLPLAGYQKPHPTPPRRPLPKRPNRRDRDLTYGDANQMYRIAPYGDYDNDTRLNVFDCRPLDSTRHAVPTKYAKKKVHSYTKPATWSEIWTEAEMDMPRSFKDDNVYEERYSDMLSDALLKRERVKDTPFKDVVGTHEIDFVTDLRQVALIQDYIHNYLAWEYPEYQFIFEPEKAKYVTVIHPDGTVRKDVKVANYFKENTPKQVKDLLTQLGASAQKIKVVISDYPVDILKKSTIVRKGETPGSSREISWRSCETLRPYGEGQHDQGPFADISNKNAVAWIYLAGKTPGKDSPTGRIQLRWAVRADGTPDIGIENLGYPWKIEGGAAASAPYIDAVQRVLNAKGFAAHPSKTPYTHEGWSDVMNTQNRQPFGVKIDYKMPYPPFKPTKPTMSSVHDYKKQLLYDEKIPTPFLYQLSGETDVEFRKNIAAKRNIPKALIHKYSRDTDKYVRTAVASREDLPSNIQMQLLQDSSSEVRANVLMKLLKTKNYDLLRTVPPETILKTLGDYGFENVQIDDTLAEMLVGAIKSSKKYSYLPFLPSGFVKREFFNPESIREIFSSGNLHMFLENIEPSYDEYKSLIDFGYDTQDFDKEVMRSVGSSNASAELRNNVLQHLIKIRDEGRYSMLLRERSSGISLNYATVVALMKKTSQPLFLMRFLVDEDFVSSEYENIIKYLLTSIKDIIDDASPVEVKDSKWKKLVLEILSALRAKSNPDLSEKIDELKAKLKEN